MERINDILRKTKQNNTGSTLIVVVVCVMFIGILAAAMLMTSYMNYQMKLTDKLSKVNFYSAEGALDQASAGLKTQSEKSLSYAFEYTEKYYSATPESERSALINRMYVTDFFSKLASAAHVQENSAAAGTYVTQKSANIKGENYIILNTTQKEELCAYLKTLTLEGVDSSSISDRVSFSAGDGGSGSSKGKLVIAYNTQEYYIEIKNLKITYTDEKDYQTTITTDLRLAPPLTEPYDYFKAGAMKKSVVDDYAIIADKTISIEGESAVEGNVYSGGNIEASSNKLTLDSPIVSSRGSLEAKGSGSIVVGHLLGGERPINEVRQVWVQDIITSPLSAVSGNSSSADDVPAAGGADKPSKGTNIKINGDCYVADDLIMNDPDYDVNIEGSYYGYNTGSSSSAFGSRYDGSAIGINAANADLGITGTLWLAGKNIIQNASYIKDSSDPVAVKEGESLSYKWTQSAYLIPGECIEGADGQNPMPASVFDDLTNYNSTNNTRSQLRLDFANYPFITQINIENYLDEEHPYTYKYVQQYNSDDASAPKNVVYVYMNFADDASASAYFAKYASYLTQRTALTAAANILGYGKVKLSDDVLNGTAGRFTGNILLFDSSETQAPGTSGGDSGSSGGTAVNGNKYKNTFNSDAENSENLIDDPFRDSVTSDEDSVIIGDTSDADESVSGDAGDNNASAGADDTSDIEADKPATTKSYTPFGSMTLAERNRTIYSGEIVNKENECNYQYNGLISVLDKNTNAAYPDYDLVDNLTKSNDITGDDNVNVIYREGRTPSKDGNDLYYKKEKLEKGNNGSTVLVKGDGNKKHGGIVVADCDVYVTGHFYGTIITTGNVILQGNARITAAYTVGFANIAKSEDGSDAAERVKVTYRNWKKNA